MKRFGVAAAQCKCADVFPINRLPADRYLRFLRVILAMRGRLKWECPSRQHGRGVLAVPLFALGKINLKAVKTGKVPRRAGEGDTHFLVNGADITVHACASTMR